MSALRLLRRVVQRQIAPEQPPRGQILVMFALMVTVFAGMLGLALDVGYAYSQRRTVQNAADAAAMAGARMVAKWTSANPTAAQAEAQSFATMDTNKIASTNQTLQSCVYVDYDGYPVDYDGNPQGNCTKDVPTNATGVRVVVTETHPTWFIQVIRGDDTVTTSATATAHVQRRSGYPADAPFILCGTAAWGVEKADGVEIDQNLDIIESEDPFKLNPSYVGYTFRVASNKISNGKSAPEQPAGCGTPSASFNGLAEDNDGGNAGRTAGSYFKFRRGTNSGPTRTRVNGIQGCNANEPPNNCVLYLPVATTQGQTERGKDNEIWVAGFAAFFITEDSKDKKSSGNDKGYLATLLDDYITVAPGTNDWCLDCGGDIVIRMTD